MHAGTHVLMRVGVGGSAPRVFDPNPVAVLNDTTLNDRSTIPAKAYSDVDLPDVAPGALLDGPFVTTVLTSNRVRSPARKFLYRRGKRGF